VVEDSLTVRRYLAEVLQSDPGMELVGEAGDGSYAIHLCQELRPDVITMDMMLPGTSGLAATEYIMAHCPTPILIVSGSTNRADLFKTYDALAAGAVDVLEKPSMDTTEEAWRKTLLQKVRVAARIPVITHLRGRRLRPHDHPAPPGTVHVSATGGGSQRPRRLVAIGASTGGPAAILEILGGLPAEFDLPILFVLHLSGPLGSAFADWLGGQTDLPVSFAQDGMVLPPPGRALVLMAPPDHHLMVKGGRLRWSQEPERHSCRPSIDVLFESLAREAGPGVIACLLTGMGRDGAEGLSAIRRVGGATLAQDEATSVVFGMPAEAIRLGAAERVLPLSRFAETINALAAARAGESARP
jgi:two-component system chemotaxis response regulator CheB